MGSVSKGAAELLKNGLVTPVSPDSAKGGKPGISGGRDISSGTGTARRGSGADGKNIDIWPDSPSGKSGIGSVSSGASPASPTTRPDGRRPYDPDHTPVSRFGGKSGKGNEKDKG